MKQNCLKKVLIAANLIALKQHRLQICSENKVRKKSNNVIVPNVVSDAGKECERTRNLCCSAGTGKVVATNEL